MKLSTIQVVNSVSEITPNLFLTSAYGATKENIDRRGITLLVNCAQELPKQDHGPHIESVKVFLDDTPYAPINAHFDPVADKIHEHVHRGGRVMIHCLVGVSRSTSLLLAYLMKHRGMSLKTAFDLVSSKRSVVRPNPGFWRQLIDYEKKVIASFNNAYNSFTANTSKPYGSSRNVEIPIHITPRSTSPDLSSSGFITRPYSSSSTSHASPSSYTSPTTVTSGTRYIPVSHQAPPPSRSNNYSDYGSGVAKYTTTPSSRLYTNSTSSSSPLLDKFRKSSSYYDPYVPAFSPPTTSLYDEGPKFGKGSPYSTTYRSSYGRF